MLDAVKLRSLLDYAPGTGVFIWRVSNGPRAVVGTIAGTVDRHGYRRIRINNVKHSAHRLAWLYVTGKWPPECMDHKNRVRDDNRFSNLRLANRSQNGANQISGREKSGRLKGAHLITRTNRWSAIICKDKKRISLGTFDTEQEAHATYIKAARRLFGEYATV